MTESERLFGLVGPLIVLLVSAYGLYSSRRLPRVQRFPARLLFGAGVVLAVLALALGLS